MPSYRFHELAISSPIALPELVETTSENGEPCALYFEVVDGSQIAATDDGAEATQQLTDDAMGSIVGFGGGVEFVIPTSADHLVVRHVADVDHATMRHFLLDQVLPRLLALRGLFTAHASGVNYHDRTLIFLGASGSGKSSMAAGLHHAGFRLLGDDCFTLEAHTDGTVTALSTYRSLRLLPPSINEYYSDAANVEFSTMGEGYEKVRLVDPGFSQPSPLPVAGIFLLDGVDHFGEPQAEQLSGRDSMVALVQNSFRVDTSDGVSLAKSLDQAEEIVRHVPVVALRYERSFDQMALVHQVIFDSVS